MAGGLNIPGPKLCQFCRACDAKFGCNLEHRARRCALYTMQQRVDDEFAAQAEVRELEREA